jgi:hypothetical protein
MASLKQTAANRRNAQRSTGPRTAEGKAASSANALRTGIYAECETVLPTEDPGALNALTADYFERFNPQTPEERCLVDCLVSDEWLLRRFRRVEGEILTDRVTTIAGDTRTIGDAYGMTASTLERLQRRINATRKSYLKTLEALNALQSQPARPDAVPVPAVEMPSNQSLPTQIGFVPTIPSAHFNNPRTRSQSASRAGQDDSASSVCASPTPCGPSSYRCISAGTPALRSAM